MRREWDPRSGNKRYTWKLRNLIILADAILTLFLLVRWERNKHSPVWEDKGKWISSSIASLDEMPVLPFLSLLRSYVKNSCARRTRNSFVSDETKTYSLFSLSFCMHHHARYSLRVLRNRTCILVSVWWITKEKSFFTAFVFRRARR